MVSKGSPGKYYQDEILSGFRKASWEVLFCSVFDTRQKLLDHIVSGASFLTGGVFECDLAYRRPVTVL